MEPNPPLPEVQEGRTAQIQVHYGKKLPVPGMEYSNEQYSVTIYVTSNAGEHDALKSHIKGLQVLAKECVEEMFRR